MHASTRTLCSVLSAAMEDVGCVCRHAIRALQAVAVLLAGPMVGRQAPFPRAQLILLVYLRAKPAVISVCPLVCLVMG